MDELNRERGARSSSRSVLIVFLLAFLLGGAIAGYAVYRYVEYAGDKTAGPTRPIPAQAAATLVPGPLPSATTSQAAQQAQAVERVAEQQGGIDQRLAAAEQRIDRLGLQAEAASGNAARAEGLLIAFSARRALDRGNQLGYLADQLRLRFGDAMPQAVQTVVAFGQQPVTIDRLIAQLDGLAPKLTQSDRRLSWSALSREMSQLFVVRRETTPSPQPRLRLERARLFLQSGRVEAAVAEVRNTPGVASAGSWLRDAERYAAAQNALDLIETAAVLEPRRLRDGQGNAIEQSSPATAPLP